MLSKKYQKRLKELKDNSYEKDDSEILKNLKKIDKNALSQVKMLIKISETHIFDKTEVEYFSCGEDMKRSLIKDLKSAEKFIFMEYFIIEEGAFWSEILKVLKEKVSLGVDVRVLYDDVGCMYRLSGNYYKTLNKMGIKATPFSRLKASVDGEFNNRNHRKITIIDGKISYTGGINIADEYINLKKRFGHWKDSAVRLMGDAVWELTRLFYIDYGINVENPEDAEGNLYPKSSVSGDGLVIPFGDGPNPIYKRRVGKGVITNMLNLATEYAYITTPYLIADNDTLESIENAALRGVDVKIILPHIPDKKLIFKMSKSFYHRLLRSGVEIYEYEIGFVHAKNYIVDGKIAMIGTINLDYRSLVHHFENGVFLYGNECIKDIKNDFIKTLEKSIRIKEDNIGLINRVFCDVVRIFAPLL